MSKIFNKFLSSENKLLLANKLHTTKSLSSLSKHFINHHLSEYFLYRKLSKYKNPYKNLSLPNQTIKNISIKKNTTNINIYLIKYLKQELYITNYGSIDTSHIEYQVYLNITYPNYTSSQYFSKSFLTLSPATKYFSDLKEKVELISLNSLLSTLTDSNIKKISLLNRDF